MTTLRGVSALGRWWRSGRRSEEAQGRDEAPPEPSPEAPRDVTGEQAAEFEIPVAIFRRHERDPGSEDIVNRNARILRNSSVKLWSTRAGGLRVLAEADATAHNASK